MSNDVAKLQERLPVAAQMDSAAIISVIERAATNPDVDIDKMERLMAMAERMDMKRAESAFNEAMSSAQAEMRPISADSVNPQTRSKYASYAKLDNALRPVYTTHGFAMSFNTADGAAPDCMRVVCIASHRGGFSREYHVDMPSDGKGAKGGDVMTKTHAAGAAMSYGMRYLLKMIFNVAIGEDDNDGNTESQPVSAVQATMLAKKLAKCTDKAKKVFADMYGAPNQVAKSDYDTVDAMLEVSIKRAQGGDHA